jgi:putative exosortase-associated protein (TIGR04073 family)
MRLSILTSAALGIVLFAAGCTGPETKLGRGINNVSELTHFGEFDRAMEQTALASGPDAGVTKGFFHGLTRTVLRGGVGIYEIATAPFPPYDPIMYPEWGAYPDSYKHGLFDDSVFSPDANLGFSGGEILPILPGSRFHIFDN